MLLESWQIDEVTQQVVAKAEHMKDVINLSAVGSFINTVKIDHIVTCMNTDALHEKQPCPKTIPRYSRLCSKWKMPAYKLHRGLINLSRKSSAMPDKQLR